MVDLGHVRVEETASVAVVAAVIVAVERDLFGFEDDGLFGIETFFAAEVLDEACDDAFLISAHKHVVAVEYFDALWWAGDGTAKFEEGRSFDECFAEPAASVVVEVVCSEPVVQFFFCGFVFAADAHACAPYPLDCFVDDGADESVFAVESFGCCEVVGVWFSEIFVVLEVVFFWDFSFEVLSAYGDAWRVCFFLLEEGYFHGKFEWWWTGL